MAFCYPGKGSSGDLPPPSICANRWRTELLSAMPNITLTLLIGQYAQKWHLANNKQSLTERVKNNDYASSLIALPHPSPRNNIWLKKNAWFEQQQLSKLQQKVARSLR